MLGYSLNMSEESVQEAEGSKENKELDPEKNETSEETQEIESSEAVAEPEEEVVLGYPDRVPNAERGASHKHSYVMLVCLACFLVFSLIISIFTMPF